MRSGNGFYRAAWGFLRPMSDSGQCVLSPHPMPDALPRLQSGPLVLAMYKYLPTSWHGARVHKDSIAAATRDVVRGGGPVTAHLAPVPDVMLQYRMCRRELAPFRLHVSLSAVARVPPVNVHRRPQLPGEKEVSSLTVEGLYSDTHGLASSVNLGDSLRRPLGLSALVPVFVVL